MASTLKLDSLSSAAPAELMNRVGANLPKWVALALVILIGWQIANILFMLLDSPDAEPLDVAAPAQSAQASDDAPAFNVNTIREAQLFGELDKEAAEPQVTEQVVGKTNLNLELKGTIAADDPVYARAIIADGQREENVYALKDSIAQGVTLHAVERERVILNQSGRLTSLDLPREFKGNARTTRNAARPTRVSSRARSTATSTSVRQALTDNVASLTDIIRPQPYFSGGQQKGYRVYPGKDRKQFAALGLRPGDLVTEINGTPMTDPRQGMQVFRSLGEATSVNVTIERNGQPQSLTLSTSQLDLSQ
ncbi:MAG: type II secretion system protein GspC [Pseudomonadota bacterium]